MTTHILILCTHNSARSVLAEAMLNHLAAAQGMDVRAHSAGSAPSGRIHPQALEVLAAAGVATQGLRSKSWDEFSAADAPPMDIVITVCDSAAEEACPLWPGNPVRLHWGYADPSSAPGGAAGQRAAFEHTRQTLVERLQRLLALPLASRGAAALHAELSRL